MSNTSSFCVYGDRFCKEFAEHGVDACAECKCYKQGDDVNGNKY